MPIFKGYVPQVTVWRGNDAGWHHRRLGNTQIPISPEHGAAATKHLSADKLNHGVKSRLQARGVTSGHGSATDGPELDPHVKLDKRVADADRTKTAIVHNFPFDYPPQHVQATANRSRSK
jgi:hypothetical protein